MTAAFVLCAVMVVQPGLAEGPRKLDVELYRRGASVLVNFEVADLITKDLQDRLQSGLTVRVVYKIRIVHGEDTVASTNFLRQIRYLLWDGVFLMETTEKPEPERFPTLGDACAALSRFHLYPLTPRSGALPDEPLVVKVRIVVDPATRQDREKVREWLLNPQGRVRGAPRGLVNVILRWFMIREDDLAGERFVYRSPPTVVKPLPEEGSP